MLCSRFAAVTTYPRKRFCCALCTSRILRALSLPLRVGSGRSSRNTKSTIPLLLTVGLEHYRAVLSCLMQRCCRNVLPSDSPRKQTILWPLFLKRNFILSAWACNPPVTEAHLPRVVGIARSRRSRLVIQRAIKYVRGDATDPRGQGLSHHCTRRKRHDTDLGCGLRTGNSDEVGSRSAGFPSLGSRAPRPDSEIQDSSQPEVILRFAT